MPRLKSTLDEPHEPAGGDDRCDEEDPAVDTVADHAARRGALRNTEDHGRAGSEEEHRTEVGGGKHLDFPPDAQVVGVDGGDEVQQAGDHDKLGAVVSRDQLYGALAERKNARDEVEDSGADVAGKTEDVERITGIGHVYLGLH